MVKRILLSLLIILSVPLAGCEYVDDLSTYQPASKQDELSVEQIKADLIGHRLIVDGQPVWEFAALSEYEQFDVKGKQTQGNAIEYDVSMKLRDFASDTQFLADVFIVYKNIEGKWELVSVVTKLFEPIDTKGTY